MNLRIVHRLTFVKPPLEFPLGIVAYTRERGKDGKQTIVVVYPQILRDWDIMCGEDNDKDLKVLVDYIGYVFTHELIFAVCAEDKLLGRLHDNKNPFGANYSLAYICTKLSFKTARSDFGIKELGRKLIGRHLGISGKIGALFNKKSMLSSHIQ